MSRCVVCDLVIANRESRVSVAARVNTGWTCYHLRCLTHLDVNDGDELTTSSRQEFVGVEEGRWYLIPD